MYQQNIVIVLISIVFLTHSKPLHISTIISQKSQFRMAHFPFRIYRSLSSYLFSKCKKKMFSEQLQFSQAKTVACNDALNCWHLVFDRFQRETVSLVLFCSLLSATQLYLTLFLAECRIRSYFATHYRTEGN